MTAAELEYIEKAKAEYRLIDSMAGTEGWKLFMQWAETVMADSYKHMMAASNSHDAAKNMGAYHVASSIKSWPESKMAQLAAVIQDVTQRSAQIQARR